MEMIFFKPSTRNENLHETTHNNGVRAVDLATSKKSVKRTMFPNHNIHKYTWTKLQLYVLFCTGMKLGLSHYGKNIDSGI